MVLPGNDNSGRESSPMPYPLYLYLSISMLLDSFTDPNNQLKNVKSMFEFLNCDLV